MTSSYLLTALGIKIAYSIYQNRCQHQLSRLNFILEHLE